MSRPLSSKSAVPNVSLTIGNYRIRFFTVWDSRWVLGYIFENFGNQNGTIRRSVLRFRVVGKTRARLRVHLGRAPRLPPRPQSSSTPARFFGVPIAALTDSIYVTFLFSCLVRPRRSSGNSPGNVTATATDTSNTFTVTNTTWSDTYTNTCVLARAHARAHNGTDSVTLKPTEIKNKQMIFDLELCSCSATSYYTFCSLCSLTVNENFSSLYKTI